MTDPDRRSDDPPARASGAPSSDASSVASTPAAPTAAASPASPASPPDRRARALALTLMAASLLLSPLSCLGLQSIEPGLFWPSVVLGVVLFGAGGWILTRTERRPR